MLRRASQQALQRLPSLLEWGSQSQAAGGTLAARQQRAASSETAESSLKFSRERKGFEKDLAKLRKQWGEDWQRRQAREAAQAEGTRARREAAVAQKQQQDLEAKEARKSGVLAAQQAARELRLAAKAQRLQQQALRNEVLEVAREERRQVLLNRSRNWVTPETLDQRIREAIDNPVPLFHEQ